MPGVQLNSIALSFGERVIFDAVNFHLDRGDRVALTGANGSGKSSLMKIIAGEAEPDSGQVSPAKNTRISYLPQSGVTFSGQNLWEEVELAYREFQPMIEKLRDLESKLSRISEGSCETGELLEEYRYYQDSIADSHYYDRKEAMEIVLQGLGFLHEDFHKPINTFSGGWQMRIALAKVLLERPDILLLDEPTNYLDIEARAWLADYLNQFKGGFLLVSHDRYFLDNTVNRIAEVYGRKLTIYKGNYSEYEVKRAADMVQIMEAYNKQQEEISRIEMFIKRFRYNSSKAKLVQSRMKALEKMELIERPPGTRHIHFSFPAPPRSGDKVLTIEGLKKSYGEKVVIKGLDLEITRGERLALVGPNGAGKTTLIKMIAGALKADSGNLVFGNNVTPAVFNQESLDSISSNASVIEEIESVAPTELIPQLRNLLGAFLFSGDDIFKPLSVLSGGEKSRVQLLKLLLHPSNLLLLDEPTNHLDMVSKDVLLDSLKDYEATLIFVSHDHYFLKNLATKVLELKPGQSKLYYGDFDYYLYRKDKEDDDPSDEKAINKDEVPSQGKSSYEEEKRRKGQIRSLEKQEEKLLEELELLEKEKAALESKMGIEEIYSVPDKIKDIKNKIDQIEFLHNKKSEEWEKVAQELLSLQE
ncbi:MAG: ABC-F family ATP-binding cassette domain-containing protein [Spirochaetales bacterium]|nr:ABC-F family ATP-binding cassette domain-containing protein [Spirochaetales bacterium]